MADTRGVKLLVIEVSDGTLRKDMMSSTPLRAASVDRRSGERSDLLSARARDGRYRDVISVTKPDSTPVPGLPVAGIDLSAARHVSN
jgi:hypothetical protein